jgi:predicted acyl esterase
MFRPFLALLLVFCGAGIASAAEPPSPPKYGVRMVKQWIPMKDGVRLAVTLYMPDGAAPGEKFPALLEYLPYRKDDDEAMGDYELHTYFARRGYAGARVDIRGFGNSEGTPPEREYSEQEQVDGEQVIAWLARQTWSNGNVGMLGISWGGFNSIQMAMRRPPELKAIIAVDATEELFKEDVHYIDGMFHVDEYELSMDLDQGRSGAPEFSLDEKVIGPRMDSPPWTLLYLKNQRDGKFWRSPVRPLSELQVPCFLIGGMQDGYRDSVPRMLEQMKAPVKALVGPWNHMYPNDGIYGPRVEWRDQAVRWFDYWLKGRDTGVLKDPRLLVYMQHWHAPSAAPQEIPGEWRKEQWPPNGLQESAMYLQSNHTLGSEAGAQPSTHELKYVASAGVEAGFWWGELLADQRPVDAYSLVYDSAPLEEETAILGRPRAMLQAAADFSQANWFVRLSDVAPDGRVTMVTGAGRNGAQRDSMAEPEDLEPGKIYALNIEMHLASWVFPKGHRIRVAISNALWPMVWPTPSAMTTSLRVGGSDGSRLLLPVVPAHGEAPPAFAPPEKSEERTDMSGGESSWPGTWTLLRDEANQKSTVYWQGRTSTNYPWGKFEHWEKLTYEVADEHPESNSVRGEVESSQRVSDHVLTWRGHLLVTSDAKNFYYKYTRELLRDEQMVRTKTWAETIARDHQ